MLALVGLHVQLDRESQVVDAIKMVYNLKANSKNKNANQMRCWTYENRTTEILRYIMLVTFLRIYNANNFFANI
jgi:hypothetical protein